MATFLSNKSNNGDSEEGMSVRQAWPQLANDFETQFIEKKYGIQTCDKAV